MKFQITKPCADCPFRKDVQPFLTGARAKGIADSLRDDHQWFACHETTGVKRGKWTKIATRSQCAGSMIVLWREGLINIAMRIALVCGLLKREVLESRKVPVFDTLDEFVAHHSETDAKKEVAKVDAAKKSHDHPA